MFSAEKHPQLSTTLPGGHRFEARLGKGVRSTVSVSIRMYRKLKTSFTDFNINKKDSEVIINAVKQGKTIIISGGTSSGKTTFLNLLISYIPLNRRILTVEDTYELVIPHKNVVNHMVSRSSPGGEYSDVIDHLMRSRPDIIITGELSIANAFPILRMLNSGHAGFMCTVYANSCKLALEEAIPRNIELSGKASKGVSEFFEKTIDIVVQLHRNEKGYRCMTEMQSLAVQALDSCISGSNTDALHRDVSHLAVRGGNASTPKDIKVLAN